MVFAPARVRIDRCHQFGHGGLAVALHAGRIAASRRYQPVTHH